MGTHRGWRAWPKPSFSPTSCRDACQDGLACCKALRDIYSVQGRLLGGSAKACSTAFTARTAQVSACLVPCAALCSAAGPLLLAHAQAAARRIGAPRGHNTPKLTLGQTCSSPGKLPICQMCRGIMHCSF